jgi:hypothetical protein
MKLAWRHEFRLFIIEHASFIFLNQEGLWILQTVSVEFLPPAMRGRMLSAHHDLFTSVITSKAANGYHFKTGQRDWPSGTENVLPYRLLWWQVGFGAPASRAALEHVTVVQ